MLTSCLFLTKWISNDIVDIFILLIKAGGAVFVPEDRTACLFYSYLLPSVSFSFWQISAFSFSEHLHRYRTPPVLSCAFLSLHGLSRSHQGHPSAAAASQAPSRFAKTPGRCHTWCIRCALMASLQAAPPFGSTWYSSRWETSFLASWTASDVHGFRNGALFLRDVYGLDKIEHIAAAVLR